MIGRAVKWGRSLYLNIQRFIMFQMTVNVVASLIVFVGSFMGMQSPLTVTQMLWVNLIMDTFAAMALASLPPSEVVMRDKPRSRNAFIITRAMWTDIIGIGILFFAALVGLLYYLEHTDLTSLTQIGRLPLISENKGMSDYELSVFFTTFVFMNFWNMFNARAYATGRSALHLKDCGEFIFTILLIVVGQIVIVSVGGRFFSVTALDVIDWVIIIGSTSVVLWGGEIYRLLRSRH
ncbi:MAG: cation transporting ATPase C-terminal domain-containing protein [Muribaculaceae bacterium]|nr:cation transporting ATPase C-terminal domain-containing protein [Muribaculaceae bacterium]